MPLDPQAQAVIDQFAALGLQPRHLLTPAEARQQFEMRAALAPPGEPVTRVEDRTIAGPGGDIPIRIYAPAGDEPLPVVVFFHGGGWVIGNIASHDATVRSLTNASGCMFVSVDYRLAPETKFPGPAEDCYVATTWVEEHAAAIGADRRRIAVAGDSAGGNLAAAVALMARDRGGPALAYQLLIYPVTDHSFETASYRDNAEGYLLSRKDMEWFWQHYLAGAADGANPYASPLRAVDLAGLPPASVITAEFDPLRDEGEAFAERLRAAGVATESRRYDGMIHGFFNLAALLDQGKQAIVAAGSSLRTALVAQPVS